MYRQTQYVVVMGVSGSGKTEIARRVAEETNNLWLDADDHHPSNNVEHMRRGQPLNDEMRWPWLEAVSSAARATAKQNEQAVASRTIFIACSALKRSYREVLSRNLQPVTFVFLDGTRDVIKTRLERRVGHFMPSALLDSQLADLEPPGPDENCVTVLVDAPIDAVVSTVISKLPNCENGSSSIVKENTSGKPVCQGEDR